MADHYIDQDETQIYGPYAARQIRRLLVGQLPPFDEALTYLANEIEVTTAVVKTAVDQARAADAGIRAGGRDRRPAKQQALELLGRLSKHLDGHKAGVIDRKKFFTHDGTVRGVGHSSGRVLVAVNHIVNLLGAPETPVTSAADWLAEFTAVQSLLAPVIEHADDAKTDRRVVTPQVEAARTGWLQVYQAAKSQAECVLRLVGGVGRLSTVFHDLAVPADSKVTVAPPDPPAPPAPAPVITP